MIKSWNFIDTKFNNFLIAGRQLSSYAKDSTNHFNDTAIAELTKHYSNNFDNLNIFQNKGFIGLTPDLLRQILDISAKLPICCKIRNETVLYITNANVADSPNPRQIFANADKNSHIVNLDTLDSSPKLWLINTLEALSEYNTYMQESLYKKAIENEVYVLDRNSVYFAYDTVFGKNTIIEPNVYFGNDVVIADNVTIKSFSYLEGVTIEDNVIIGPFARIRPTSKIERNAKIGNFVEIKNSALGSGTKAGHLAYIGDSDIGSKVNIGAGVVTCNYDGRKKHQTKVGNNTFLGTNSSIIAPITIGHNAFIGAGSFINKDVPDGSFAVGRSSQKNKLNTKIMVEK